MLYYLIHLKQWLLAHGWTTESGAEWMSPLRIFGYITFRALAGAATAFLVSVLVGPWLIRRLRALKIGQIERTEHVGAVGEMHKGKAGTPTMGGLMIIVSVTLAALLWSPPNFFVLLTLASFVFLGMVGFLDDYLKLHQRHSRGLPARIKLVLQIICGVVAAMAMLSRPGTQDQIRQLMVPMLKQPVIADMGIPLTVLFVTLVIVGSSNAVNLTDGLDGLAIGCTSSAALAYMIMAYAAGHVLFAEYLNVPHVVGGGELTVFCGCLLGGSLGFLWYNCHPAQVFMGDTGSLALGGAIALVALLIKQEVTLVIVGGVFVVEALSVILQVASFKLTGRRIFAMSPIHHHFELRNWSETQITVRFWILSIIFALIGVATLKIR